MGDFRLFSGELTATGSYQKKPSSVNRVGKVNGPSVGLTMTIKDNPNVTAVAVDWTNNKGQPVPEKDMSNAGCSKVVEGQLSINSEFTTEEGLRALAYFYTGKDGMDRCLQDFARKKAEIGPLTISIK